MGPFNLFNVTKANVIRFLPDVVHINIQVYETKVENLIMVRFIFTILLNMIRCFSVILHVFQELFIMPRNRSTCKITGQQRVMFNKIININHTIAKYATIVPYTCIIMCTNVGKKWTTFPEVTLKILMGRSSWTRACGSPQGGKGSMDNHIITKFATAVPYA